MMRTLFFGLVVFLEVGCCNAQSAREVIERYLDTVSNGDVNNWKRIKSIITESEGFYSQAEAEQSGINFVPPKKDYMKSYAVFDPGKLKIEIYGDSSYNDFLSSTLWLPDQLILGFKNMPPIVKPGKRNIAQDDFFMPLRIWRDLDEAIYITHKGVKEFSMEGVSCFEIEVKRKDEKTVGLYFNTTSYLLEFMKVNNDSDLSTYARFSDYCRIDGLLFFMTSYASRHGRIFHFTRKKRIHINQRIEDEKFQFKGE